MEREKDKSKAYKILVGKPFGRLARQEERIETNPGSCTLLMMLNLQVLLP
jgi:hypothetical protein